MNDDFDYLIMVLILMISIGPYI